MFFVILNIFVWDGLGNGLVQRKESDELDFSSVLIFNFVLAIAIYLLLFLSAPVISKFCGYSEDVYKRQRHYGLDTYGLRYFNVFGRRQDPNGAYAAVIPKFIKQLMNDESPTINGDGRQSRDFTYIENVIEANLKACLASHEAAGEAFNIAFGGREFLIDIYNALTKTLGKNIEPIFGPDRTGDIKHSNADISKAKRLLKYADVYKRQA